MPALEVVGVKKQLGTGGFADVFVADVACNPGSSAADQADVSRQQVALKCAKSVPMSADVHFSLKSLLHEARVMGSLRHRNIVRAHGIAVVSKELRQSQRKVQPGNTVGLALEHCSAGTLSQRLHKCLTGGKSYTYKDAVAWAIDLASAVAHLHSGAVTVIHRDLKPENVLLHYDADADRLVAKLTDFGLSAYIENGTAHVASRLELVQHGEELLRTRTALQGLLDSDAALKHAPLAALPSSLPSSMLRGSSSVPRASIDRTRTGASSCITARNASQDIALVCEAAWSGGLGKQGTSLSSGHANEGPAYRHPHAVADLDSKVVDAMANQLHDANGGGGGKYMLDLCSAIEEGVEAPLPLAAPDSPRAPRSETSPTHTHLAQDKSVTFCSGSPKSLDASRALEAASAPLSAGSRGSACSGDHDGDDRSSAASTVAPGIRAAPGLGSGCLLATPSLVHSFVQSALTSQDVHSALASTEENCLAQARGEGGEAPQHAVFVLDIAGAAAGATEAPSRGSTMVPISTAVDSASASPAHASASPLPCTRSDRMRVSTDSSRSHAADTLVRFAEEAARAAEYCEARTRPHTRSSLPMLCSLQGSEGAHPIAKGLRPSFSQPKLSLAQAVNMADIWRGIEGATPTGPTRDLASDGLPVAHTRSGVPRLPLRRAVSRRQSTSGLSSSAASAGKARWFDRTMQHLTPRVRRTNANRSKWQLSGKTGSVAYMAPEVIDGSPYNAKIDVFSLSVMLWELFAGARLSWSMGDEHEMLQWATQVASAAARQPFPKHFPPALRDIISAGWAQDPADRPTAAAMLASLEAFAASEAANELYARDAKRGFFCSCFGP